MNHPLHLRTRAVRVLLTALCLSSLAGCGGSGNTAQEIKRAQDKHHNSAALAEYEAEYGALDDAARAAKSREFDAANARQAAEDAQQAVKDAARAKVLEQAAAFKRRVAGTWRMVTDDESKAQELQATLHEDRFLLESRHDPLRAPVNADGRKEFWAKPHRVVKIESADEIVVANNGRVTMTLQTCGTRVPAHALSDCLLISDGVQILETFYRLRKATDDDRANDEKSIRRVLADIEQHGEDQVLR